MSFGGFATWVVAAAFVGWLAGILVKDGGHGLAWDLVLALAGSGAAGVAGWIFGGAPSLGAPAMVFFAFAGAAIVIGGQRKLWPAPPVARRKISIPRRA